jgi:hypothetical protein
MDKLTESFRDGAPVTDDVLFESIIGEPLKRAFVDDPIVEADEDFWYAYAQDADGYLVGFAKGSSAGMKRRAAQWKQLGSVKDVEVNPRKAARNDLAFRKELLAKLPKKDKAAFDAVISTVDMSDYRKSKKESYDEVDLSITEQAGHVSLTESFKAGAGDDAALMDAVLSSQEARVPGLPAEELGMLMDTDARHRVALSESREDLVIRQLTEKLDKEIVVQTHNYGQGDFRSGSGPMAGSFGVRVSGATYDIKDQLKKLGLRFDPRTKSWALSRVRSDFGSRRKQPTEDQMKSVIASVKKIADAQNKKLKAADREFLGARGHADVVKKKLSPKEAVKKIDASGRVRESFKKYGVEMGFESSQRVAGFGDSKQPVITFKGNTYPLRSVFKKSQFSWKGGMWVMSFDNYNIVKDRFVADAMRELKSSGRRQASDEERPVDPKGNLKTRLSSFKDRKRSGEEFDEY